MSHRMPAAARRPGTFDWIIDRTTRPTVAQASPSPLADRSRSDRSIGGLGHYRRRLAKIPRLDERGRLGDLGGDVQGCHRALSQELFDLVAQLAQSVNLSWNESRVFEFADAHPLMADFHHVGNTADYHALVPDSCDLCSWSATFPEYLFLSGNLTDYASAYVGCFDWVESIAPIDPMESDLSYRRRLQGLTSLVAKRRHLLTRERLSASPLRSWIHHQAILARAGLYVRARHALGDGTELILATRTTSRR